MRKESTGSRSESRPEWEQLEDWVRSQVPEADPGVAGGGGDGVSGKGEVGAQIRLGLRYRLSERIRQSPEAYAEFGNDTA